MARFARLVVPGSPEILEPPALSLGTLRVITGLTSRRPAQPGGWRGRPAGVLDSHRPSALWGGFSAQGQRKPAFRRALRAGGVGSLRPAEVLGDIQLWFGAARSAPISTAPTWRRGSRVTGGGGHAEPDCVLKER